MSKSLSNYLAFYSTCIQLPSPTLLSYCCCPHLGLISFTNIIMIIQQESKYIKKYFSCCFSMTKSLLLNFRTSFSYSSLFTFHYHLVQPLICVDKNIFH
uniref:Uncharacterized protein n=1 Tax=Otus sunia TaxID=257818 RepID=A0A8C8AWM3_9STRI